MRSLIWAGAAFILVASPWLIRNVIHFGNPFHIVGSAGFLRVAAEDPLTYTPVQFLDKYGLLFPFKRVIFGGLKFFRYLHDLEHGLEVIPLLGVVIGIVRRRNFYHMMILTGVIITFLACAYGAYVSLAGVRYFSSIMPFIYAYGVWNIVELMFKIKIRRWGMPFSYAIYIVFIGILLSPVFYPHRFYERKFAFPPSGTRAAVTEYTGKLSRQMGEKKNYYAQQLCQVNFLTELNCVGLQDVWDYKWFKKSIDTFNPQVLAFRPDEYKSQRGREIFDEEHNVVFVEINVWDTKHKVHVAYAWKGGLKFLTIPGLQKEFNTKDYGEILRSKHLYRIDPGNLNGIEVIKDGGIG